MLKRVILIACLAVLCLAAGFLPEQGAGSLINYQGKLINKDGTAVSGTISMQFSIYATSTGGTPLWTETQSVITNNGIFNVLLGSSKPFPNTLFTKTNNLYLGTKVGSDPEMTPRFQLFFPPIATHSDTAQVAIRAMSGGGGTDPAWVVSGNNAYSTVSNYGFGTKTPEKPIHVKASGADAAGVSNARIIIENGFGHKWFLNTWGFIDQFSIGNMINGVSNDRLIIDKNGNVGIGAAPSEKLRVVSRDGTTFSAQNYNSSGYAIHAFSGRTAIVSESTGGDAIWAYAAESANGTGIVSTGKKIGIDCYGQEYAGIFNGNVLVKGTLKKSAGSFTIDHPLDPVNKTLSHSFVESPDMMNIYNGNVVLNANGEAWVELPKWFEALNQDFRYQLTAIGAPAPNLYIAEEISGNHFKVVGGQPGAKISWQVTGIRHDPYANAHRIAVEEGKPASERGYYYHPKLYGQPEEKGIEWARNPETMQRLKKGMTHSKLETERLSKPSEEKE